MNSDPPNVSLALSYRGIASVTAEVAVWASSRYLETLGTRKRSRYRMFERTVDRSYSPMTLIRLPPFGVHRTETTLSRPRKSSRTVGSGFRLSSTRNCVDTESDLVA